MIKKEIFIGSIIGLIANTIGLVLKVLQAAASEGFLGKLISLGAILNLIVFFVFIKKKQDYRARGVLLITVFIAIFTFVFKFI